MSESGTTNGDHRLSAQSLPFAETLYELYLQDKNSVEPGWRDYFDEISQDGSAESTNGSQIGIGPSFTPSSIFNPAGNGRARPEAAARPATAESGDARLQHQLEEMIRAFRSRGHAIAKIDPIGIQQLGNEKLDPASFGFTDDDLERPIVGSTIRCGTCNTVRDAHERLHNTYCRSIAVQYMHIHEVDPRDWLMERMEKSENRLELSPEEHVRIFSRLTDAVAFEEFIQTKYLGAKSFSLEGAESLIPLLDLAIEKAGEQGIDEIVLAMAHRGRINVLANIMGKQPHRIFREFEDADPDFNIGGGDVKYHLGYSNDYVTKTGRSIHLSLCFNPSHLEFVSPVAIGRVRAKQDYAGNTDRDRCLALVIHGDAAFAGEGVVQETLNLSQLEGYRTGGTLHIIVNNQIGFTTTPEQSRSSRYTTGVARMLQIPIFHVNGEDPEAVAQTLKLAMEFRHKFKRDVIIDMYCYRRRGHNEGDEPEFTQPQLYQAIRKRKPVHESYLEHVLELGGITREQADEIFAACRQRLEDELSVARGEDLKPFCALPTGVWAGYRGGDVTDLKRISSGMEIEELKKLLIGITTVRVGFHPHRKIARILSQRREMGDGKRRLDWATAEALAFASFLTDGKSIRMTGQDCERGTFSHRHAVLHDVETGEKFIPLNHIIEDQETLEIHNSPLSEAGVLGFEYGYSLDAPNTLTVWEAQFGDFVNAAQVIIDQFISSAEDKWHRLSGIVMLLPHGFEGMGPEHSSARLERFLMLSADNNMQVVVPTTPAQYFHCLRRQMLSQWRKPLIIMSPKSLLRNPACTSPLEDLSHGRFERIIADDQVDASKVGRVLLCSGKIYFELIAKREELGRDDVAILRIEQLYPMSKELLTSSLEPFEDGLPVYWVQEEPRNMGAWPYMRVRFGESMTGRFRLSVICRDESASPATGSASSHKVEQAEILEASFA